MSDVVLGAIIGVIGGVSVTAIGAFIVGRQQKANTLVLIESEFKKLSAQISGESRARFRAKKEDWLRDVISDLLFYSDPELHTDYQYDELVIRIHKAQVILDPREPVEAAINHAVTALGLGVRDVQRKQAPNESLLRLQGELVKATQEFFRRAP